MPFPFPYAQLLTLIITGYACFIPLYITCFTQSMIASPILTYLLFTGLWGVNEVAKELENPFGSRVNEISLGDFHARFLDVLHDINFAHEVKEKIPWPSAPSVSIRSHGTEISHSGSNLSSVIGLRCRPTLNVKLDPQMFRSASKVSLAGPKTFSPYLGTPSEEPLDYERGRGVFTVADLPSEAASNSSRVGPAPGQARVRGSTSTVGSVSSAGVDRCSAWPSSPQLTPSSPSSARPEPLLFLSTVVPVPVAVPSTASISASADDVGSHTNGPRSQSPEAGGEAAAPRGRELDPKQSDSLAARPVAASEGTGGEQIVPTCISMVTSLPPVSLRPNGRRQQFSGVPRTAGEDRAWCSGGENGDRGSGGDRGGDGAIGAPAPLLEGCNDAPAGHGAESSRGDGGGARNEAGITVAGSGGFADFQRDAAKDGRECRRSQLVGDSQGGVATFDEANRFRYESEDGVGAVAPVADVMFSAVPGATSSTSNGEPNSPSKNVLKEVKPQRSVLC